MMMRLGPLLMICVLCACNAPGPAFRHVPAQRISVGPSVFDLRVAGNRAQAIRLSPEWAPRPAAVAPRAVVAMERGSGCRVDWLRGDQAVMEAGLDCGENAVPLPPAPRYDCAFEPVYSDHYADLICTAVY